MDNSVDDEDIDIDDWWNPNDWLSQNGPSPFKTKDDDGALANRNRGFYPESIQNKVNPSAADADEPKMSLADGLRLIQYLEDNKILIPMDVPTDVDNDMITTTTTTTLRPIISNVVARTFHHHAYNSSGMKAGGYVWKGRMNRTHWKTSTPGGETTSASDTDGFWTAMGGVISVEQVLICLFAGIIIGILLVKCRRCRQCCQRRNNDNNDNNADDQNGNDNNRPVAVVRPQPRVVDPTNSPDANNNNNPTDATSSSSTSFLQRVMGIHYHPVHSHGHPRRSASPAAPRSRLVVVNVENDNDDNDSGLGSASRSASDYNNRGSRGRIRVHPTTLGEAPVTGGTPSDREFITRRSPGRPMVRFAPPASVHVIGRGSRTSIAGGGML